MRLLNYNKVIFAIKFRIMKKTIALITTLVAIAFVNNIQAQPPDPGGGAGNTPSCFPPPCVPVDGGLSWLLIAGTIYGGKKIYNANKDKQEEL